MKKKKIVICVLIMCLLCTNLLSIAVRAEDSQPTTYNVHDSYEFRNAVKDAKDGDIITVCGAIDINTGVQIGSNTKHLTIQRVDGNSYIIFNYVNVEVTNIVFDGCGIKSSYSWVTTNKEATFTNCTFQDFGSSETFASSGSIGGAVKVQSGSCVFNDCLFSDNYALIGGHIAVLSDSQVELNCCILKNGGAVSQGGAIANNSFAATCNISGGEITGNQSLDFGGGVSNAGTMNITGAKVYANSAVNGGADIATKISGCTTLTDAVEQLNELFRDENIEVTGWVCDYNFDENIYIPDVDPNQENALLKLQYSIIPEQSTEEPTETPDPTESGEDSSEDKPTIPTDTETSTEQPGTDEGKEEGGTSTPSDASNSGGNVTTTDNSTSNNTTSNSTTDNSSTITNSSSSSDNSTHSNVTNNDNRVSTTDNSDRSSITENYDSSDRSVVNNYYTEQTPVSGQGQQMGNSTVIVIPEQTTDDKVTSASSDVGGQVIQEVTEPNIKIDAKGVDCVIEYNESGGYNISISSGQVAADAPSTEKDPLSWVDAVQIALLAAIFICLVWKPKKIRE